MGSLNDSRAHLKTAFGHAISAPLELLYAILELLAALFFLLRAPAVAIWSGLQKVFLLPGMAPVATVCSYGFQGVKWFFLLVIGLIVLLITLIWDLAVYLYRRLADYARRFFYGASASTGADTVKDSSTCFTIKYPQHVIVVDPESSDRDVHLYLARDDEVTSNRSVSPGHLYRCGHLRIALEAACNLASKSGVRQVSIVHLPIKDGVGGVYGDPFEKIPSQRLPKDFRLEIVGARVMDFPTAVDLADSNSTLAERLQKPLTLLYSKSSLAVRRLELTLRNLALANDCPADVGGDFALVVAYKARVHCINVGFVATRKTGIRVHGAGTS